MATNGVGLASVLAAAYAVRVPLALGDNYPFKAGGVFALTMLIAIGYVRGGHPFDRFGPANQITALRAGLVALAAGVLGESFRPAWATSVAVAGLLVTMLDGVDGWTARRTGMSSAFGARFDMETDALLIFVLSGLAWQSGKAGAWILFAGLLRYLFVGATWAARWMRRPLPPSQRRRAVCALQIAGLSLVMLPIVAPPLSVWLSAALLVMLTSSFFVDTRWLWQHRE